MTTATSPDFRYWDTVDPSTFLAHDWQNPSRVWATGKALAAVKRFGGTLLEIGPGPGVDYERHFRAEVKAGRLDYMACEGSRNLCDSLVKRFPESEWRCRSIAELLPNMANVVYARHVMEHQPALEPAFRTLLDAASKCVVLTWYRPPGPDAFHEVWEGVHCHTFARRTVLRHVKAAGFVITAKESFASGDEGWVLERQ